MTTQLPAVELAGAERSCEKCGAELVRREDEDAYSWRRRRFCNQLCANRRNRALQPPKYPAEKRWCEKCGESLGVVPGWKIAKGEGRFCSNSCSATLREARRRRGKVVTCSCGRETRYLRPSAIARGNGRYCKVCRSTAPELRAKMSEAHRRLAEDWRWVRNWCRARHPKSVSKVVGRVAGRTGGREREYTPEQAKRIRELRQQGRSQRAIARIVGVSHKQVRGALADRGTVP